MAKPRKRKPKDTFQLPCGIGSMIDALINCEVTSWQFYVYARRVFCSNWETGEGHSRSYADDALATNTSRNYIGTAVRWLVNNNWLQRLSGIYKRSKFQITHHKCDMKDAPLDRDGRPKMCAVKRIVFELVFSGNIHWKAAVLWTVLKVNFSNWSTGVTDPITIDRLQEITRFGRSDVIKYLNQLIEEGLLERKPRKPTEASVYVLYPLPAEQKINRTAEKGRTWRAMRQDGNWRISFNEKYRINTKTTDIQIRRDKKVPFRNVTDEERMNMPSRMKDDFEKLLMFHSQLRPAPT